MTQVLTWMLITLLQLWVVLTVMYTLYLAAINVYSHWGQLAIEVKIATLPIVIPMLALDCFLQLTLMNLFFWDIPRDWLITQRLQRYRREARYVGWRMDIADLICTKFLNPFDLTQQHC